MRQRIRITAVAAAALPLLLASCAKPAFPTTEANVNAADARQQVRPAGDRTCRAPGSRVALNRVKAGFSQSEPLANPFRATETASMTAAAKARVGTFVSTNANSDATKQVADIRNMVAQGARALVVAPLGDTGLQPALATAAAEKVPVVLIDRKTAGRPCRDYVSFVGSDFREQGRLAARHLVRATGGHGKVAVLLGVPGTSVSTDRTAGFEDVVRHYPGLRVVASQTAGFDRTKGQNVMAQMLQANPDIDAVYAENDTMAMGAMVALKDARKRPGRDVAIVSIDGTREAVQAVADGELAADVETNPRFGPVE